MVAFLLRGLLGRAVLAVVGASLVYLLAAAFLHPRAELEQRFPRPPRAAVEDRLSSLGLNDHVPLLRRYGSWASRAVHGDLGETLDGTRVTGELRRRAGVSLRLVTAGALLGTVCGIAGGACGAAREHGWADRLLTAGTLATLSVPAFALAVLLQTGAQWINASTGAGVFEWTGEHTPARTSPGLIGDLADRARHLLLPTATIALGQAALYTRYQRATMLDAANTGYVRAAMARGLTRRRALTKHALRVAVIPTTTFATYGFATLLVGTAITEKTYAWHGLGEWLLDSITRNDVNAVAACGCAATAAITTAAVLSDLARLALDPRTRP